MALPHSIVPGLIAYRKSWFDEVGATTFPKTYDELRAGRDQAEEEGPARTARRSATPSATRRPGPIPLLWNFGGMETDRSGKTAIDSKGSVEAVKFMQAFWKDACDEGGLAWDDTNNNRAFLGGEICATLNGASIYIAAKRGQDKIKDDKGEPMVRDIQHARLPGRPGRLVELPHRLRPRRHEVHEERQKLAKDFLKWFHGAGAVRASGSRWPRASRSGPPSQWERHPLWNTIDEPMKGFKTAADNSRVIGYAGPPSAKATEVYSKYVIVDMFAKGVQGMKAEDAVKWAEGELKKIYG